MKICRFLAGDADVRIGLVKDDGNVVDLTPAGITTLSQVLESDDPRAMLSGIDRDRRSLATACRTSCFARRSSGRKYGPRA